MEMLVALIPFFSLLIAAVSCIAAVYSTGHNKKKDDDANTRREVKNEVKIDEILRCIATMNNSIDNLVKMAASNDKRIEVLEHQFYELHEDIQDLNNRVQMRRSTDYQQIID